jgi:hypothetical protein
MLSFQAFGQMSSRQNVLAPQKMFKCFPADIREPFERKGRQAHLILKSFALKKYYQPSKEEGKNTRGVRYKTFFTAEDKRSSLFVRSVSLKKALLVFDTFGFAIKLFYS